MFTRSISPHKWKNYRRKNQKLNRTHHQNPKKYHTDIKFTNNIITEQAKIGRLDIARKLFDEMPERTVVSWNTIISGYSKWNKFGEALRLVSMMHSCGTSLNESSFSTVLSMCAHSQLSNEGRQIHCTVLKSGFEEFEFVGSTLLYFYAKCLGIKEAKLVFDELHMRNELLWSLMLNAYVQWNLMSDAMNLFVKLPKQDVIAWTNVISGYARTQEGCTKALELFSVMRKNSQVTPNEFTFDSVIRACGRLGYLIQGSIVHGIVLKHGFESDHSIGCTLIEFYCECESVFDAKKVYHKMAHISKNASNLLLSGLINNGRIEDAELIFSEISEVDTVSYNLMIKGYAACGRFEDSKRLFERMPCRTIVSSNTMITVYSRNNEIDKAFIIFEETKDKRNPVTWNSMLSTYTQNDRSEEALRLFKTMCSLSIDFTRSTFSVLFQACSCLGSLQQGQSFHAYLIKTPFESNVYVATSLIDMYSKCGSVNDAQSSFMTISSPNVTAWTALIHAYAYHGLASEAVSRFESMLEQRVAPNAATFVGILSGCSRAGLLDKGMDFFYSMEERYGVKPVLEHYTCVVDLLGRSGYLNEAEKFIRQMPIEPDGVVWGALLSACWFWKNMEVGERVAEKMFSMEIKPISAYVILSNIYAELGKWGEKMSMRKRLKCFAGNKNPGCSWIELNSKVCVFSVDDRTHPYCNIIYTTLEHLTENMNSIVCYESYYTSIQEDCCHKTAYCE